MNKRLVILADRRCNLLNKIDSQRKDVAELTGRWQTPLAVVDTRLKAVNFLHNHPTLVVASVAAIATYCRKGIAGLASEGWRSLYLYLYLYLPSLLLY